MMSKLSRRCALIAGALIVLAPAAVALAQAQHSQLNGIYRGTITQGANTGAAVVVTVFAMSDDRVSLKSNRPGMSDGEYRLKADGDNLVNIEGDGKVVFKLKPGPAELHFKPNATTTFVGQKPVPTPP